MNQDNGAESAFWPQVSQLASIALFGAALLAYLAAFRDEPRILFAAACLVAAQFVSSLVHESAHAAAALACRWRVVVFAVRPLGVQVPNRNLAVLPKRYNAGAGGWVSVVPRDPGADTRRNWSIIVAAGPVASLLLAAFAVHAWATWLPGMDKNAVDPGLIGLGLGLQSLHGGIWSLLPGARATKSDGDLLRTLPPEADYNRNRPVVWLTTLLGNNVRLSAIPDWMMAEAKAAAPSSEEIARYVATVEIGRTLDRAPVDVARARSLIDAFRARYGADGWLAACDAYLAAIWEGDAERARAALAEAPEAAGVPQLTRAAEAAIAARRGDSSGARSKLAEMKKALAKASPFRDLTYRDIASQIESLLDERGAALLPAHPAAAAALT